MDQLAAMKVFAKVAEAGSFTKAADALDLSRAMVSTQVAALEKRYGVRLLNRTTRRVALTGEGTRYLEHCRRVFGELQAAEDDLNQAREQPRGRLRVDVPGPFGRHLLMPALPEFLARYPEIEIDIRVNDRYVDLVADQVDVAVRGGTVTDPNLVVRRAVGSHLITCAAPGYLERHGWPAHVDDLRTHRRVGFRATDGSPPRPWIFEEGGRTRTLDAPLQVTSDSPEALLLAAIHGAGVIQTMDLLAARPLEQRELVVVLPGSAVRGPPVSVVYPPAGQRLAKVRVFADFTLDLLRRWQRRVASVTGLPDPG
jgi:LysR family transcriptional regulator, regulator for bpeEF and oprC